MSDTNNAETAGGLPEQQEYALNINGEIWPVSYKEWSMHKNYQEEHKGSRVKLLVRSVGQWKQV